MPNDEVIIIGDKVELIRDEGRVYKTMVEDITGNGFYLVGVPTYGAMPVLLHYGDEMNLLFSRKSGKYSALMSVVGFEKRGEIRYAWLMQRSGPRIYQRREAYRLPMDVKVLVCEYREDFEAAGVIETVSSKDISITGIALVSRKKYDINEKLLLKPYLEEEFAAREPFIARAEVVRTTSEKYIGRHYVGTRFFAQPKSMSDYLARYVVAKQQEQFRLMR